MRQAAELQLARRGTELDVRAGLDNAAVHQETQYLLAELHRLLAETELPVAEAWQQVQQG